MCYSCLDWLNACRFYGFPEKLSPSTKLSQCSFGNNPSFNFAFQWRGFQQQTPAFLSGGLFRPGTGSCHALGLSLD
jgi:hypothetical protein